MTDKEKIMKQLKNETCATCVYHFVGIWETKNTNCCYRVKEPKSHTCNHWKEKKQYMVWISGVWAAVQDPKYLTRWK